ncbi:MAG: CmpA/NrtA family ABC transporter substrate-binding protein [Phormidesmis sp.]
MPKFSRRRLIGSAGAIAASSILSHSCASAPQAEPIQSTPWLSSPNGPEVNTVRLGYIALTDAAPLIVAQEKGHFRKYGLDNVEIIKQASWGTTRDELVRGGAAGGIDGAHILTPMPYLMTTGAITGGEPLEMNILARLNVNGQGISLANIYKSLKVGTKANRLKDAVELAKTKGPGRWLKVAMTFPGGTHDLWIRYWLAAGGIDPDNDVSMYVVPPPQMVANMKTGTMHMLCVGQPWNAQLIRRNAGHSALTTGQLWLDHPEKALALRADWVRRHPRAAKAMLMAVLEAQIWCDQMANKKEMCEIIATRQYFGVPAEDILERVKGNFDFGNGEVLQESPYRMKFWQTSKSGDNASYPYQSHDLWFLTENIRWGYLPPDTDMRSLIATVNREDLWREAAIAIDQVNAIPKSTSRGIETFFDGVQFDPQKPADYLNRQPIKKEAS